MARIFASYGKTLSQETKILAKKGITILAGRFAVPPEQQFNQMPKGAGYKGTYDNFTLKPQTPLAVGNDSEFTFEGALNNVTDD